MHRDPRRTVRRATGNPRRLHRTQPDAPGKRGRRPHLLGEEAPPTANRHPQCHRRRKTDPPCDGGNPPTAWLRSHPRTRPTIRPGCYARREQLGPQWWAKAPTLRTPTRDTQPSPDSAGDKCSSQNPEHLLRQLIATSRFGKEHHSGHNRTGHGKEIMRGNRETPEMKREWGALASVIRQG